MTEDDVIRALVCCSHNDCNACNRESNGECVQQLMKDANNIIKLQKNAIEKAIETNESLLQTVRNYETVITGQMNKTELIRCVNEILESNYDAHECGDYFGNLVCACQKLIRLLKLDAQVVFGAHSDYPQIQMKNN